MHADPPMSLPFPRDPEALAPPGPEHPVDALRTAITYGTFDLFHIGHVRLLQRIKERFDFVIVAVSTDEFNALKGKKSVMSFDERMEVVKACRWVDLVIAETGWDQKERDIMVYGVSPRPPRWPRWPSTPVPRRSCTRLRQPPTEAANPGRSGRWASSWRPASTVWWACVCSTSAITPRPRSGCTTA
jgi:cytidyltransferase-like protein